MAGKESWAYSRLQKFIFTSLVVALIVVTVPFLVVSIALAADWDTGMVAVIITRVFVACIIDFRVCVTV